MSDIFISYSRKDSERALSLAERLRGEGMSVWIDQQGIEAAKTWSEEIVNAIESSKAFVLLLSAHSVESINVARELSLAFESERPLVPIAIDDVALTPKFKYPLAGIQRVAYTQFSAITAALLGCGIEPLRAIAKKKDERKSLLVMPFEDLSPTQDNLWFADGLAGELIDKLSHIKSLRLIDRKTSRDLRTTKLSSYEIAETLEVQYLIEGSVRKFGEQIKISISLLDVAEGDYLWQESHKGVMDDVFELQEQAAESIVSNLKLQLLAKEEQQLAKQPTSSSEAYEFYLKGRSYYALGTQQGFANALQLYNEALELDPKFELAIQEKASLLLSYRIHYDKSTSRLRELEATLDRIKALQGESAMWCALQSAFLWRDGKIELCESFARRSVEMDPLAKGAQTMLGIALSTRGDIEGSLHAFTEALRLDPSPTGYQNVIVSLIKLGEQERLKLVLEEAVDYLQRYLKLNPDDHTVAMEKAYWMAMLGDEHGARLMLSRLPAYAQLDAHTLYVAASVHAKLGETVGSLQVLRCAVDAGFVAIHSLLEDSDFESMKGTPEFEALVADIERAIQLQAETQA
jgi:adenylate cyclase